MNKPADANPNEPPATDAPSTGDGPVTLHVGAQQTVRTAGQSDDYAAGRAAMKAMNQASALREVIEEVYSLRNEVGAGTSAEDALIITLDAALESIETAACEAASALETARQKRHDALNRCDFAQDPNLPF